MSDGIGAGAAIGLVALGVVVVLVAQSWTRSTKLTVEYEHRQVMVVPPAPTVPIARSVQKPATANPTNADAFAAFRGEFDQQKQKRRDLHGGDLPSTFTGGPNEVSKGHIDPGFTSSGRL